MKIQKYVLFVAVLGAALVLPHVGLAQSLSEARGAIQNEANQLFDILKIILRVIFAVGLIGVVWAYSSKDNSAKEYLTSFIIAMVIGAIGQVLFFAL